MEGDGYRYGIGAGDWRLIRNKLTISFFLFLVMRMERSAGKKMGNLEVLGMEIWGEMFGKKEWKFDFSIIVNDDWFDLKLYTFVLQFFDKA